MHAGLPGSSSTASVRTLSSTPPPLHLSSPKPLRSDNSMDCLSRQFSKLGPQEDTFCSSRNHSFPRPPSAATCSESGRREGSWDSRFSSFRAPCESDESQGYSQYSPVCSAQRNASQMWAEGNGNVKSTQSSSFSIVRPMPSGVASGKKKKHFLCGQQKFCLYFLLVGKRLSSFLRNENNFK